MEERVKIRNRYTAAISVTATLVLVITASTGASGAPVAPASGVASAEALVAAHADAIMSSSGETYAHGNAIATGGFTYVPYERTYKGLPVVGGDFVVVTDSAGKVVTTSVAQNFRIGSIDLSPVVSAKAAETMASTELTGTNVESSRLVVSTLDGTARLAWQTTVNGTGAEGYSRQTVTVDAKTGAVLDRIEHVMSGTGRGNWEGNVTVATRPGGSGRLLSSPTTNNMPCQNAATNTTFTGADDIWGDNVGTNRETGCVDALYGAEQEALMLSSWLGRNGMNGSGSAWPIRVGLNQVNAFYDGTQVQIGHRQGTNEWIGATDVIAHEMGHGVDNTTPGGISRSGTQEFVADVFGAATEFFANNPNDPPDFTVGEEINLVGSGPIRVMYNPSLKGHPNCYSSSIPGTEVHAAAGPGNHWFYLLAIGSNAAGQPASPTCNGSTVTGIGVRNAMTIFYKAMLMKTTSSSYLRYRVWTLQAAKNNTPGNCAQYNAVKAAWNAVSVPAQAGEATCP
jgi:Zn-dependent metalloprotease